MTKNGKAKNDPSKTATWKLVRHFEDDTKSTLYPLAGWYDLPVDSTIYLNIMRLPLDEYNELIRRIENAMTEEAGDAIFLDLYIKLPAPNHLGEEWECVHNMAL